MDWVMGGIGAVVGFFTGGPIGAVIGFGIGYGVGSILNIDVTMPDSETPGAPDIQEINIVTCKEGDPIPDLIGGAKIVGNIFMAWGENAVPITQTVQSGGDAKDPEYSEVTVGYNYYLSWAQAFCYVTSPVTSLYTVFFDKDIVFSGKIGPPVSGGMQSVTLGVDLEDMDTETADWSRSIEADVHSVNYANDTIYLEGDIFNFDSNYPYGYTVNPNWRAQIAVFGGAIVNFTIADWAAGALGAPILSTSYNAGTGLTELVINTSVFTEYPVDRFLACIDGPGGRLKCNLTGTYEYVGEGTVTVRGTMHFFFGTDDQVMHSTMQAAQADTNLIPGYKGLCYAFFDNIWLGTFNRCPNVKVVIKRYPSDSEIEDLTSGSPCECYSLLEVHDCGYGEFGYNPACAVWYIASVLVGIPTSLLSRKWFIDACYALCDMEAEGSRPGVALLMNRQMAASQYIDTILQHCSGYLLMSEDGDW